MKKNNLLTLVFAAMVTMVSVSIANELTIDDFKIFDSSGQAVSDKDIQANLKRLVDVINETQQEVNAFIAFIKSKKLENTYNYRPVQVPDEDITNAYVENVTKGKALAQKIRGLLRDISDRKKALRKKLKKKNLTSNLSKIAKISNDLAFEVLQWELELPTQGKDKEGKITYHYPMYR